MIDNQIQMWVEERKNRFRPTGKEWALNVRMVGTGQSWTFETWESKPAESTLKRAKELIIRSFAFYHHHLRIPQFKLEVVGTNTGCLANA